MKNAIHLTRLSSFAAAACLLVCFALPILADTAVSSWTGASDTNWSNADNWTGGAPSSTNGAAFDAAFSVQPMLSASSTVLGVWLKDGVGQDVTIDADASRTLTGQGGAILNGLIGISGNNSGTYILLDDAGNHNLTFGPNIKLSPPSASTIYVNNAGTLTIEGSIQNPNGLGVAFAGTNALGRVRITGTLVPAGGGSIRVNTSGTVVLEGASPDYAKSFYLAAGTLRVINSNALQSANYSMDSALMQLRDDDDAYFMFGANGIQPTGSGCVIDVDRLDPEAGAVSNKTIRVNAMRPGNGTTVTVTGGNGYSLAIDDLVCGNGYTSAATFNPTTAPLILGNVTSKTMSNGGEAICLAGTNTASVVTGAISNPSVGQYGINLVKNSSATWRLEGTNAYTRDTSITSGRLIAAHDRALGFGGEARRNETGTVTLNGSATVLEITGATVNKPIAVFSNASILNDQPDTEGRIGNGVAYVSFTDRGSGFTVSDSGRALTFSGGDGTGAGAVVASLCANTNTVTASGGTGWVTGNQITLSGGGAAQNAIYTVTADAGGAIVSVTPYVTYGTPSVGYGYTSLPTGYTGAKGTASTAFAGTGATVVFHDDFSICAVAMTDPGEGYTSAPSVSLDGTGGVNFDPAATISSITADKYATEYALGGEGNLFIDAQITDAGRAIRKVGSGILALSASNTYACATVVAEGTLSALNTTGSATGTDPVTVLSGATLAGSGTLAPTASQTTLVSLESGARIAPHVGTGSDTATLDVDVSASSASTAMNIAGGSVFAIAIGGEGASDCLRVTGNLTMEAGINELQIVKQPGMDAGVYTIVQVVDGIMDYSVTDWTFPADSNWAYRIDTTDTEVLLSINAAGTVVIVR